MERTVNSTIPADQLPTNGAGRKMTMLWSLVREAKTLRGVSFEKWSDISGVPVNTLKRWQVLSDGEGEGIEIGGAFRAITALGLTLDQFTGIAPRPDLKSGEKPKAGTDIGALQELLQSKEETIESQAKTIHLQEVMIAAKDAAIASKDASIAHREIIIDRQLTEKHKLFIMLNNVLKINMNEYDGLKEEQK